MSAATNTSAQSTDTTVVNTTTTNTQVAETNTNTSANVAVMNWLMAAQDVMKSQTQTEYASQESALNALDLRNASIDSYNTKYAQNVDKMNETSKSNGTSNKLKIAGMVLLVVAVVALVAIATVATGGLAGAPMLVAGAAVIGAAGAGCLIGSSATEQDVTSKMDTLTSANQYIMSKIQGEQTKQNQDTQVQKMHSDNITSAQNNFNNLINFQKSTTSKF